MQISSQSLANATALRQQADKLRAQLLTKPDGWVDAHPPTSSSYDNGVTTEHRWLQAPDGDTLNGFVSQSDQGLERFEVSHVDRTDGKTVKVEEYGMRAVAPPAWTAAIGESAMNLGLGLTHSFPGGFLLGLPLVHLGRALTFDESEPKLNIYRHEDREAGFQYAVFNHQGEYLGSEVRPSQRQLFS